MIKRLKEWLSDPYSVGKTVFWDNPVDYRFREEFTIFKTKDNRGLVGVYNKNKGERYAYISELIPVENINKKP